MGWLFRSAPRWPKGVPAPDWPPAGEPGPISEDWRAGDLARCVAGGWQEPLPGIDPEVGDVLRVTKVMKGYAPDGTPGYGLQFEGKPQDRAWCHTAFRKLRPAIEAAEDEFVAELRDRLTAPALTEGSPA